MRKKIITFGVVAISFLLSSFAGTAQQVTKVAVQKVELVHSVKNYKFDQELQKIYLGNAVQQNDIIFDNTNFLGSYFNGATPSQRVQDWGTSPGGMVSGLQIGIGTASPLVNVTIIFYEGTTDADTGAVIATIPLTGLTGSSDGTLQGLVYDITLGSAFELPAGAFGYAYTTADADGPLIANGGQGITDNFRILPSQSLLYFGGNPFAQFWLQLTGEAFSGPPNDECAQATDITTGFTDNINTTLATSNPNDPVLSCAGGGGGNTVWYTFTSASTKTVSANTFGSNYDTALGLFTGACGSLTELDCNDDVSGIQSEILWEAQAGITYIIHVAEFGGGSGGGNLVFHLIDDSPPTLFQGPASTSIPGGSSVTTDDFSLSPLVAKPLSAKERGLPNEGKKGQRKDPPTRAVKAAAPVGANFVKDLATRASETLDAPNLITGFAGIPDLGVIIPPDPHMAVGLNHIMAVVNSRFAIWDKSGNLLKMINTGEWFNNVLPGGNPFDPQIVYDHHSDRWIMIWIDYTETPAESFLLLSVSDDSNPLGTWCNWNLPGNQNGTVANTNLNDYPKIGVDENAVYVSSNQFDIVSLNFQYVQLRVIPKAQLINNTCGSVGWTDFWDLRNPSDLTEKIFTSVPAVTFGAPGIEYFLDVDFIFTTGTFMNLWSLTNPLGTPALSAATIPVTAFTSPPDANQSGGGTPLIDVGGRRNRNVVYKDGSVWTAHSVGNGTGQFASARYVRIDVSGPTVLEDASFGADDFWYYYPAIQPDADNNMVMAFTRSGLTEYASARYTGRLDSDPPGLQTSALLKAGEANYVKTFSGTRNRWGDYMGVALDPDDNNKVWMFVEYAESPANTWGTWVGSTTFETIANDDCGAAAIIAGLPFTDNLDARIATSDPGDPTLSCAGGGGGKTVWYTFTPVATQTVSVNTFGSDYNTALAVFTGSCGSLTEITCNDDAAGSQSEIVWQAQAGIPYLIQVAEFNGGAGGGNLVFSMQGSTPATPLAFKVERTTGDVYADGSFIPGGADLAEHILVSEPVEPGDVVELDPVNPQHYRKARGNGQLIAGVITTAPGFILGNNLDEGRAVESASVTTRPMLALMGRVPVKVTTENGPIRPGDRLTLSSKPGYAMRAHAGSAEKTTIGKALESLENGTGKILVFVMVN